MIKINRLSNEIQVVTENLPYYRTATLGIWVCAGSVNENKDENGLAHMLEHMFFKGTINKTAKELADGIALIGDDVNAFTSKEYTAFYGTTTSEHIFEMINLIGEMLFEALFDEQDIRKEKRVIIDEIDMYEDSPEDLVHDMIQSNVFKGHPLANIISGSKKTVRSFKKEHLIAFKEKHYIPSNIVISIAGCFDETKLINQLEEVFGRAREPIESINDNKALLDNNLYNISSKMSMDSNISEEICTTNYQAVPKDIINKPVYNKCFSYKYKDIEQVHINLALPSISTGSSKRFAFSILNSIFGGSNNSRLFQTIREDSGLAYSVYSYTSEFKDAGLFHIDVTVNPLKIMDVLNMIINIINSIKEKGIEERELNIHKSQIITELIMGNESTKAKMSNNAKSIFIRNYAISLDENLAGINAVTKEEVHELILDCFKMENLSMCIAGAKEDIDIKKLKIWWKDVSK